MEAENNSDEFVKIKEVIDRLILKAKLLSETFDSSTPIEWTIKGDNEWEGFFITPKNKVYKIEIKLDSGIEKYKTYVFKFTKLRDTGDGWDMTLTNMGEEQYLIFGMLGVALFEFADKIKPEILFFIGDSSRKSLYQKLGNLASVQLTSYAVNEYKYELTYYFAFFENTIADEAMKYISQNLPNLLRPQ